MEERNASSLEASVGRRCPFEERQYHVKHVVEGEKHWLIFKTVSLGGGYREGSMWEGKEIARMECSVEPTKKSVNNTKVILSKTNAGERSIQEIQIAGEKVRHILLPDSARADK